jgi:hypothetical protein
MPRDLPLSNGHLQINFDRDYDLRDIYWPHTGQPNQTNGHACRTGVWVDGAFRWVADDGWQRQMLYEPDTLVTRVTLQRDDLALTLLFNDVVDFDRDILVRRVEVTNQADHPRDIRLFFHHDWHLGGSEGANTVCYRPEFHSIVAYKDHYYLLVNGQIGTGAARGGMGPRPDAGVKFWAIGYKEYNGQQGTWVAIPLPRAQWIVPSASTSARWRPARPRSASAGWRPVPISSRCARSTTSFSTAVHKV